MSDTSNWDPTGEIVAALQTAVTDYGPRVLSNPQVLGNLLKDLLPDRPREASLLVSASEVDVASILTSHLQGNLDPDTAIRLTAGTLAQSRPIDPQACSWVTTQFARALGVLPAGAGGAEPQLPAAAPITADETMIREPAPAVPVAEAAAGGAVLGAAAGMVAAEGFAATAAPSAPDPVAGAEAMPGTEAMPVTEAVTAADPTPVTESMPGTGGYAAETAPAAWQPAADATAAWPAATDPTAAWPAAAAAPTEPAAPPWGAPTDQVAPAPAWPGAAEPAAPQWGAGVPPAPPATPGWPEGAPPAQPTATWDQTGTGAAAAAAGGAAGVMGAEAVANAAPPWPPVAPQSYDAAGAQTGYPAAPPGYPAGQPAYTGFAAPPGEAVQPGWPAAGPPAGPALAGQPGGPSGPRKRSPALFGALAVVAIIAIYFIVAAVAKLPPLKASSSTTSLPPTTTLPATSTLPPTTSTSSTTTSTTTPPTTTSSSTTTTLPPASGLPITTLLPDQQSTDPAGNIKLSSCAKVTPLPNGLVGVSGSLGCTTIPGYKGWSLFGYKFSKAADYAKSFAAYDKDKSFDPSTATSTCPPTGNADGASGWNSSVYPQHAGQTLQCLFVEYSNSSVRHVAYIWTVPTQNAFFELVGAAGATGQQVETWWEHDGGPGHA